MQMEMDFTDNKFMWSLYVKYTQVHARNNTSNRSTLMTPGLFCQYFAIKWSRENMHAMKTVDKIIDELADPNVTFCNDPCGPSGCMRIYDDKDGNTIDMFFWNIY